MSRYNIEPNDSRYLVTVGYDPPLQTFFAMVNDLEREDDEEDEGPLYWVGTSNKEITTVQDLQESIREYAILDDDMIGQLEVDHIHAEPPSHLQKLMIELFDGK